jgi:hypothetical protein
MANRTGRSKTELLRRRSPARARRPSVTGHRSNVDRVASGVKAVAGLDGPCLQVSGAEYSVDEVLSPPMRVESKSTSVATNQESSTGQIMLGVCGTNQSWDGQWPRSTAASNGPVWRVSEDGNSARTGQGSWRGSAVVGTRVRHGIELTDRPADRLRSGLSVRGKFRQASQRPADATEPRRAGLHISLGLNPRVTV